MLFNLFALTICFFTIIVLFIRNVNLLSPIFLTAVPWFLVFLTGIFVYDDFYPIADDAKLSWFIWYSISVMIFFILSVKNKIVLNIKMHPVNKPKDELIEKYKSLNSISFMEEVDVAEILPNTDILITDYSSVFFDFLLTNRPIIFAPFDYEKYITKDRELYYDYDEVTPGPKCKNWEEVLEWIVKFKENPNLFKEEREEVKNRFHKYQDGRNCERVFNEIIKL